MFPLDKEQVYKYSCYGDVQSVHPLLCMSQFAIFLQENPCRHFTNILIDVLHSALSFQ